MKKLNTKSIVMLGVLTAFVIIFSTTPIGSIPIGPLVITLNIIPIALASITLGPTGSVIIGAVFGIFSFLQASGVIQGTAFAQTLFSISPVLTLIQCVVPRVLDGLCAGYIYKAVSKFNKETACFVTGFFSAFLNTVFFMTSLVTLYGKTEYLQSMINGRNILIFIVAFVGVNAVTEMVSSTVIAGAVGVALQKAKLVQTPTVQAS
ncbi:MAG: ECF transporter S component [Oscillospiraceae bacterium]|nr:ECF transporter S component [Oscillospiraceae bacterium]